MELLRQLLDQEPRKPNRAHAALESYYRNLNGKQPRLRLFITPFCQDEACGVQAWCDAMEAASRKRPAGLFANIF